MSEELMGIFADCMEAIEQGRLTVEECLEQYPQYRPELADLLQVTTRLWSLPTATPSADFLQAAPARLSDRLSLRATATDDQMSAPPVAGLKAVPHILSRRLRAKRQTTTQKWPHHWPRSLALGTALLAIVILFVGLWPRLTDKAGGRITQDRPTPIVATPNTSSIAAVVTPTLTSTPQAALTLTATAVATAHHTSTTTYIPLISSSLQLNAQRAEVAVSQGIVELQNADGSWTAVNRVAAVTTGQRVRTGPFSAATITFYDGSRTSLSANSEISIDELNAQRPEDGFRTILLTQWLGESEHQVAFRNDGDSRYEVMTPNGSGRAQGTTFQVLVMPNLLTQFIVSEGRVDVTSLSATVIVVAGQTSLIPPQQPPSQPYFIVSGEGKVTAMGTSWIIGEQTFTVTTNTMIVGNPQLGDIATVSGYLLPDGTLVATHIILKHQAPANHFTFSGEVESIGVDAWTVAGQSIVVNAATAIDESINVGDTVRVYGLILVGGSLLAERIDRVDETQPFEFVGVVQNVNAAGWLVSGVNIAIDENTEIKDGIAVGDVVKVEGVILADNTWLADEIKPAEGDAGFEFTGQVNNIAPWIVAGVAFQTDTFTEIDNGIDVGKLVYVEGRILADGTWLATEIRLLTDGGPAFTLIGTVNSTNPWIVSSILIDVDENTLIGDAVVVGSLVRIRGFILTDGTWLAAQIIRLDDDSDPIGCYALTSIVLGVSGNQVTLEGLPTITLNEGVLIQGDVIPNTVVTLTLCVDHDGTIIIISIVVIYYIPPPPPPPPPPGDGGNSGGSGSVTICHIPPGNPNARHTITVDWPAWQNAHQGHGDTLGPCP